MRDAVLMVGWSPEALAAVQRHGMAALLLEFRGSAERRREGVERCARLPVGVTAQATRKQTAALTVGYRVRAVMALTEGSVTVAASARSGLGLPGVTPAAALGCRDKLVMKQRIQAAGLRCAETLPIEPETRAESLIDRLGLPLVIKQRAASGGRGTIIARDPDTVRSALQPGWIAESFVAGTEMSLESFAVAGQVIFTNPTEYFVPGVANIVPADLAAPVLAAAQALNQAAISALEIERGMAHLELFLQPDGIVFGEIAARPPGGRIMRLIERAYGFDPWDALLQIELGEPPALRIQPHAAAGAWFLHPGEGQVQDVTGLAEARGLRGVDRIECRVKAGDRVGRRHGTGVHVGCIEVTARNRDEVASCLEAAFQRLRLVMKPTG